MPSQTPFPKLCLSTPKMTIPIAGNDRLPNPGRLEWVVFGDAINLYNLTHLASLDHIHPAADGHTLWHRGGAFEECDVFPDGGV